MATSLYRELVKILKKQGCFFVREAAGSHEIWQNALGKKFTVYKTIKKRQMANVILKQAGIDKAF